MGYGKGVNVFGGVVFSYRIVDKVDEVRLWWMMVVCILFGGCWSVFWWM